MKALFITAVASFSGKTALALGLGLKLTAAGHTVGYFKPVSTQPLYLNGKLVDEDSDFVRTTLALDTPAAELASVIIDEALFESLITGSNTRNLSQEVKDGYAKAARGKDVMLVEGGANMREGYSVGLNMVALTTLLDLPTLGVVRYRDGLKLLDDALALQQRMNGHLLGLVINGVPSDALDQVKGPATHFLESQGVRVYGVLPHQETLSTVSVGELIDTLKANVLTKEAYRERVIENVSVGAMNAEAARPRLRQTINKVLITGGDREDMQAAALETNTVALILTGNLAPSPAIVGRADDAGVAVLTVPNNTIETVQAVQKVFGKARLGQPAQLAQFRAQIESDVDTARLFADLGL